MTVSFIKSKSGTGQVPRKGLGRRLRDELLNGEIFYTLREAKIIIESWRRHYNVNQATRFAQIQTTRTGGVHTPR